MNFTREPIIETIITPKDGFKILVRSSKEAGKEEYAVDAVEVVSFGSSLFFRSQERPKSFLVPVSDYEVFEVKEARVVLKNVAIDRSVKIGGGKAPKESVAAEKPEAANAEDSIAAEVASEQKPEKKRDKRRMRRRRSPDERKEMKDWTEKKLEDTEQPPQPISTLFPPPPGLISDSIVRYKTAQEEGKSPAVEEAAPTKKEKKPVVVEEAAPAKEEKPSPKDEKAKKEKKPRRVKKAAKKAEKKTPPKGKGESTSLNRVVTEEVSPFGYPINYPSSESLADETNFIS